MKPEKIYEKIKLCIRQIESRREDHVIRSGKDFTHTEDLLL